MRRTTEILLLLTMGTLWACQKQQPTSKKPPRQWPKDDYQRKARRIPDAILHQTVIGLTATDEKDAKKRAAGPAIAAAELTIRQDARGLIHLRITAFHRRRPFVLRLPGRGKKWRLNMGRSGTVITFHARRARSTSWGPRTVPKGSKVKDLRLYVGDRLSKPVAFKGKPGSWRKLRWPARGGLDRFPRFFVLAFQLDNGQTLLRSFGIDKRGRSAIVQYHRVADRVVTPKNLQAIIDATVRNEAPKGVPRLR